MISPTRRTAGSVPQPPQTHVPVLVQADSIPEDIELNLSDEDMNIANSGELADAHTVTPPTADAAAVQATHHDDSIIDIDAADAATAWVTCPADSEHVIIDVDAVGSCETNPITRQFASSPSQTSLPWIIHTNSIPKDPIYVPLIHSDCMTTARCRGIFLSTPKGCICNRPSVVVPPATVRNVASTVKIYIRTKH